MEAKPYCFPVEWVWVTKSAEFYLIFLALDFCLFRNIFDSLWRFLRIASNVTRNIIGWSYCFSVPSYCLSRSVLQKTINISQSFQDGTWEKKALPCRNVQKGLIGASWKFRGKIFSIKRENFTVWISELFPVDLNFISSNCDTTKDDKHLKIISQWRLRHVIEKKKKRLFLCRNI